MVNSDPEGVGVESLDKVGLVEPFERCTHTAHPEMSARHLQQFFPQAFSSSVLRTESSGLIRGSQHDHLLANSNKEVYPSKRRRHREILRA